MLSHRVVEDAEHMNAQAHMCAAAALFSRLRIVASGHPSKRRQVVALYPGCSDSIRTTALGFSGPRRLWFPLPSSRPGCGDPDPLGPPPPVHPVLGGGLRSWLLGSGVVPVPLLVNTWYIVSSSTGAQQAPFFFVCLICQFYEQ